MYIGEEEGVCTLVMSVCGKEGVVSAQAMPLCHHNNDRRAEISSSINVVTLLVMRGDTSIIGSCSTTNNE